MSTMAYSHGWHLRLVVSQELSPAVDQSTEVWRSESSRASYMTIDYPTPRELAERARRQLHGLS